MTNEELRTLQKEEAIRRLRLLGVMGSVIKDFKNNGRVYYSERLNSIFCATLYWLDNHQEYVDLVKAFEQEKNALVYHCQLTHTIDGDMLSLLYVSNHTDEWSRDRDDILNGQALVKVEAIGGGFSELGFIGIRSAMGGIVRTW